MRIAFDGSTLQAGRTGVGYYTEHLLRHLVDVATDDEIVVVSNRPLELSSPLPSRVQVRTTHPGVVRLAWMYSVPYLVRLLDRRQVHRARRLRARHWLPVAWSGFRGGISLAAALAVPALGLGLNGAASARAISPHCFRWS